MGITDFAKRKAETYNLGEACKFIAHDFPIRNSGEELKKLLEQKEVDKSVLAKELNRQNVNNWLNGTDISRESAIKILLVLEVNVIAEAEEFIMYSCAKDGFYERNYKDIIYMFCLKNKLGVKKADCLIEKYNFLDKSNTEAEDFDDNIPLTEYLENKFYSLNTEEELDEFFRENKDYFGNFNRTAYKIFMEYYKLALSDIERYKSENRSQRYDRETAGIEEICEEFNNIKEKAGLSLIQKNILKDEPERAKLTNIKNKKKQVPRKYMILFFLLTGGYEDDYIEAINELNKVLAKCGMPYLDSRNPFDWIVMNSFYCASNPDNTGAIDRMKKITDKIFNIDSEVN